MKNLRLLFPFFKLCFTNTRDVLRNLYNFTEETKSKNIVIKKYGLPKGIPTIDLLELFPDYTEKVENYSFLEGTATINDMAVLKLLAKKFPGGSYIEFGTWRGESLSNVYSCIKESVSLSFSQKDMREANFPQEVIDASFFFSKDLLNVKQILHNTLTYDFTDLKGKFDLIFIDADHKYASVRSDTANAFSLLKDENSIIVFHDASRSLEDVGWQVQAGILDGAPGDAERKKIYRVSNTLCAIYINGKFNSGYPKKYVPNKIFTVNVSAKKISEKNNLEAKTVLN